MFLLSSQFVVVVRQVHLLSTHFLRPSFPPCCVLCLVSCVLCLVSCCLVFCCRVSCCLVVLCLVSCVLCLVSCVFLSFCLVCCVLCMVSSCVLCVVCCVFCVVCCVFCVVCFVMSVVCCVLCAVSCLYIEELSLTLPLMSFVYALSTLCPFCRSRRFCWRLSLHLSRTLMPPLKLTSRTQIYEQVARETKARTNARVTALIGEVAAEQRIQFKRDQEQEDNQQPWEQEDNRQPRESWTTCLNVSCFCLLLVTANALFIQYLLTRKI